MPFDDKTRNLLQRMVGACRKLLAEEFEGQLQELYGIRPSGDFTRIDRMTHLTDQEREIAELLRERIEHIKAGLETDKTPDKTAVERLAREQAFTVLNRFCALRMCEERRLIEECVREGDQSKGFRLFLQVAGSGLGGGYERFRAYLFSVFDEIAVDLGVLFDRFSTAGLLFPREKALAGLLDEINAKELRSLWAEDETIGWVYQYFNSQDERRKMRDESGAPRNSREMAVRNQFFTPRYVVEFLVDNCMERVVPLLDGDSPRTSASSSAFIRGLKLMDPACGSGHFLLYAYDLLEEIYAGHPNPAEIPKLILEHNLHGIDIDPRAVQIANLALWLRAQRSWKEQGLTASKRPRIDKTNIVCAEPMPGETEMLREFACSLKPRVLGQLIEIIFEKTKLAGEAGSLLRIEEEIREAVAAAEVEYEQELRRRRDEAGYLPEMAPERREQGLFDFADLKEKGFWAEAEELVLRALEKYAERAENGQVLKRRMFVEDASRGFAFIDVCRKQFNVVVMNPPFGETAVQSKAYIVKNYPRSKQDVYAAFVERWLGKLAPGGMLGAITSRTGFFLSSFQKWREEVILDEAPPVVLADLGFGVMDSAMVEAAAYCLQKVES